VPERTSVGLQRDGHHRTVGQAGLRVILCVDYIDLPEILKNFGKIQGGEHRVYRIPASRLINGCSRLSM
jgi:hypothetical protein